MEELSIITNKKPITIDSREVAEMVDKDHAKLMRDIRTYCSYLNEAKFGLVEYFIESTYLDAKGEERPCYLVTRKGCEICANKMQGKKGVVFTAKYVDRFNYMEKQLQNNLLSFQIKDPIERAKAWIREQEQAKLLLTQKDEIIEELSPLAELARKRIDKTGTVSITDVTKTFELMRGQISCWAKQNGYIHKNIKEVNLKGEKYFKIVGEQYKNIAITEEGLKLIDSNIEDIKNFPTRYKAS